MPEIRILGAGDERALEAFLAPRVSSSMFLLGNMRLAGLVDRGAPYQGTYAAAWEGGAIAAVAAHYWNGNVILQAPVHMGEVLHAAHAASGRPLGGFLGPNDQVDAACRLAGLEDAPVQMDEVEKLYSLALSELVVPRALVRGEVRGRRVGAKDVDLLTRWFAAYQVEAIGAADGPELRATVRDRAERAVEEGVTWVLEHEGRAVSTSGFNTAIREAVQIGGVYTPPELRSRGYARACVAQSLLDARAEGVVTSILFTGEENVAAQRAYEALGYRQIGDYRLLFLRDPVP
ncbi:MAG: GNAT family N-acetyltransferase [Anaerolineae bacterium]|nr:GNAT family N-acetyltransferase [Anaerolineae bacterium]